MIFCNILCDAFRWSEHRLQQFAACRLAAADLLEERLAARPGEAQPTVSFLLVDVTSSLKH